MKKQKWEKTANRFVAFFDIMGFKDLVARNPHKLILEKLEGISDIIVSLENHNYSPGMAEILKTNVGETKAITFSDSIVVFSKGESLEDLNKIIIDTYWIISKSIENKIPIKGALSYGEITVDFESSLFFGQPIIDAFLLHEQLLVYAAIADNHFEAKIASMNLVEKISRHLHFYKAPLKTGKIKHRLIGPYRHKEIIGKYIEALEKINYTVSGAPRIYIDNTIDFYNSILQ